MLVSGFTLEYAGSGNGDKSPAYTSSYELEITNHSNQDIQFAFVARVTRHAFMAFAPPESIATTLANLKELISGVRRNDRWTWFDGGWSHDADGFALTITMPIAAKTSELFDIIPSLFQSRSWWPRVAGHAEVTIPAVRSADPPYNWHAQANGPVPVFLNPSTVESWEVLKAGGAFSESRTSPPLSNGEAYAEIQPESTPKILRVSVRDFMNRVREFGAPGLAHELMGLSEEQRAQVLVDLLAAIDDDDREALNMLLKDYGSSLHLIRSTDEKK